MHIILEYKKFLINSSEIRENIYSNRKNLFFKWSIVDIDGKFCRNNNCHLMTDEEFYKCVNPRLVILDTTSLRKFIPIVNERVKLLQKLFECIIKDKELI